MKVAPLITVALIICIAFPCPIQAKKKPKPNKFCIGKDGNQYAVGQGYDDNDGKACVHYKCVKKKKKFVMKQGKCAVDGEWGDWSSWSDCSATCGSAIKKRTRTCSNPKPSNGGKPCHGQDKEVEECSLKACENTPTTPSIVAATSTALPIATTKPGATCTTPFQNILVVAKKGKKTYKFTCDFIMVYTNKAVVISKSSVWCKPPKGQKGLKVKVILKGDDELQFDAIVSIFPFAITAATVKGSKCNEEPTTKEPVTELPPGPVENVNVTALELNLQSLNDTVQSMLELISTMQSTANKQGTCLSDLSSSECPASAAGKVGVVDGIAANTANITTNTAGLASSKAGIATNQAGIVTNQAGIATNQAGIATNQAGVATNKEDITFNNDTCSSIQATATKLETCLSDVNSVDCPSSKGGKTSVPDAIIKNKDAVETHHPDTTPTITPTSTTATTATSSTTTADTTPTITPTSTTATTATSSTTTAECTGKYNFGFEFPGNDIKPCSSNKKSTAEACQEFCKSVPGCVGWEWGYDGNNCCAKSKMDGKNAAESSRVSGLKNACPPDTTPTITPTSTTATTATRSTTTAGDAAKSTPQITLCDFFPSLCSGSK